MRYDTTLKEVLQAGVPGLWQALGLQPPTEIELLSVEFPSVRMRKPDFLARFNRGPLVHLEVQGDNDNTMEWRELEYYQLIFRLLSQPPIQIVIYFGSAPLTMRNSIVFESLQFCYTLIDMRAINTEYLLASGTPADSVLAILSAAGTETENIDKIIQELRKLPENEQRDWFEKLMILAGARGVEQTVQKEAEKMGISLDIRDNWFFKEAYAAGVEDGVEKGVDKGQAAMLRDQLEWRFGSLPEWVRQQLDTSDRDALKEMSLRLLNATQLEDVFNGTNGTN